MISKEMLARCQNELKQAFCALPEDVQKAMKDDLKNVEWFDGLGIWVKGGVCCENLIYRLSLDTPTEPEWVENRVGIDNRGHYEVRLSNGGRSYLFYVVTYSYFLGIIYQKDGIETLRTSIDAAFGTPVRVRFLKP